MKQSKKIPCEPTQPNRTEPTPLSIDPPAPPVEEAPAPSPAAEPAEPSPQPLPAPEAEQAEITRRLAREFLQLSEEFPALQSPDQIPESVLTVAVEEKIPLLDAYLRFRRQEEKRMEAEQERRRRTAMQTAGSMAQGGVPVNPEQEQFTRSFRTALRLRK